jgi:hypothetical protein
LIGLKNGKRCKKLSGKNMKGKTFLLVLTFLTVLTANAQNSGKISGNLTYPSDYIPPDMVLCVESSSKVICSNSKNKSGFVFRINTTSASFQITLPPGKYYIYGLTKEMRGVKAYYNEFVRCGMNVKCKSKKKIRLDVKAGRTIRAITVGDFW